MNNNEKAPVKEGETLKATIEGIGGKGDGFFKKDGLIVFVKDTQPEKRYEVKITKVTTKCAFAEILAEI